MSNCQSSILTIFDNLWAGLQWQIASRHGVSQSTDWACLYRAKPVADTSYLQGLGGGFQPGTMALVEGWGCKHCSNTEILPEPQHPPGFLPGMKAACIPLPASVHSLGTGGVRALSLPLDTQTAACRMAWDSDPTAAVMPYTSLVWGHWKHQEVQSGKRRWKQSGGNYAAKRTGYGDRCERFSDCLLGLGRIFPLSQTDRTGSCIRSDTLLNGFKGTV